MLTRTHGLIVKSLMKLFRKTHIYAQHWSVTLYTRNNQHNFNYYGALQDFQVYGRQGGKKESRSPKMRDRSVVPKLVSKGQFRSPSCHRPDCRAIADFHLDKAWVTDGGILKLYHRRTPPVQVQPSRI